MTIADVELLAIELPCGAPVPPLRSLLVRLTTEGGQEGWGEVRWPTDLADTRTLRRSAALVVDREPCDIEELLILEGLEPFALRVALEMACWDAVGCSARQPLHNLWGGRFRRRIPIAWRLPDLPPPQVAALARELADRGAQAVVLTACGSLEDDLVLLAEVRRSLAGRAELWLDGGQRYDPADAAELGQQLRRAGIARLVDPLTKDAARRDAALARLESTSTAVWRDCTGPWDLLALPSLADHTALIDPQRVGGLACTRQCAAVVAAAGREAGLACGGSVGIAAAAALHLAASTPIFSLGLMCPHQQWTDELLIDPLPRSGGGWVAPSGPGLGIEVDRSKLDRFLVG
jgi:L-alanine-DL-glutamate epimerase-like enolase superfamily enzyme